MDIKNPKNSNNDKEAFPFLRNINTQKRRDLEYFIQMPSNPSSEGERTIVKYILDSTKNKKMCTDGEIIKKFFHSSKIPKKAWQNVKHRIQQTFLRYYTMRKLEDHPMKGILLAEIYDEYGIKNKKKSEIKRQKKKLKNSLDPNKELYEYWLLELSIKDQREQRVRDTDLNEMEEKLDEFYLEKKFRCLFEQANRRDIVNNPSSTADEEKDSVFIKWAEQEIENIKSIKAKIYHELYFLLKTLEKDVGKADYIESLIEENYDYIDTTSVEEFYTCLLNYYIKKINQGVNHYAKNYLDCISKMLEKEIVLVNNELSPKFLKNSIAIALIHNDTERAWRLVRQHEKKPTYIDGAGKYVFKLIQATILLHEEKYAESSNMIKSYTLKDHYHDIDAQLLTLQLDYSLKKNPSLILRNIEVIKRRTQAHNEIYIKKKEVHLAFLKALKQLIEKEELDLSILTGKVATLKWRWLNKMIGERKFEEKGLKNPSS